MRFKLFFIYLFFLFSIGTSQNTDSINKINKTDDPNKIEQEQLTTVEKSKGENRIDNYIIALIGLLGAVLASIISYRIANKQSRNKLHEIKIKYLISQKEKLENLRTQLYDRQVDISSISNLNTEIIISKFIDKLLQDISSVQKNSEFFDERFIDELNSYSQRMSTYIFQAISGGILENSDSIKADLDKVSIYDNKIKSVIDLKINEINHKIIELMNE